jgi:hypothetical protein
MTPRTENVCIVKMFLIFYGFSLGILIRITIRTFLGLFCFLVGCLFHDGVFFGSRCRIAGSLW